MGLNITLIADQATQDNIDDINIYDLPSHEPLPDQDHFAEPEELYIANITHNLGKMASAAGIYKHLWRPEEIDLTHARQLIEPLRTAIKDMQKRTWYYTQYNAKNGWGTLKQFTPWLKNLLTACEKHPKSTIRISR